MKLKKLMDLILKNRIFGKVAGYAYSIELQQRGDFDESFFQLSMNHGIIGLHLLLRYASCSPSHYSG
jgi:hypothetical protein